MFVKQKPFFLFENRLIFGIEWNDFDVQLSRSRHSSFEVFSASRSINPARSRYRAMRKIILCVRFVMSVTR